MLECTEFMMAAMMAYDNVHFREFLKQYDLSQIKNRKIN